MSRGLSEVHDSHSCSFLGEIQPFHCFSNEKLYLLHNRTFQRILVNQFKNFSVESTNELLYTNTHFVLVLRYKAQTDNSNRSFLGEDGAFAFMTICTYLPNPYCTRGYYCTMFHCPVVSSEREARNMHVFLAVCSI